MFWLIVGVMLAVAVLFIAVPLYRAEKRLSIIGMSSIATVAAVSAVLYSQIGMPNAGTGAPLNMAAAEDGAVAALAERLKENPNDLPGWKMLGRSYFQLKNYPGAIAAYERAVTLESSENGQTLAELGEAVLFGDPASMNGRAGELFENAFALAPSNPKALFYSGMAAIDRGNNELAATRWEALLATSPPPDIADVLRQRITVLRGESAPVSEPGSPPISTEAVVNVSVSLGGAALDAELPDATVFLIARDPDQPMPPIAAVKRSLSDLPATIALSDANAMMQGRVPSAFPMLEIVARVSLSGQPLAQPGDWYGEGTIETSSAASMEIIINQQVQ